MARRRRGQFPEPKQENGQWKIRYWTDETQPSGLRCRVRKTKCLGSVDELTATQARKEALRFLQPINDVEEGIEHSDKTMKQLIAKWREAVKPALKFSTQLSYEWAFKRIDLAFGKRPLAAIGKADIQSFLTAVGNHFQHNRSATCGLGSRGCSPPPRNGTGFVRGQTRRAENSGCRGMSL